MHFPLSLYELNFSMKGWGKKSARNNYVDLSVCWRAGWDPYSEFVNKPLITIACSLKEGVLFVNLTRALVWRRLPTLLVCSRDAVLLLHLVTLSLIQHMQFLYLYYLSVGLVRVTLCAHSTEDNDRLNQYIYEVLKWNTTYWKRSANLAATVQRET